MDHRWTKHLKSQEDKEKFKAYVRENKELVDTLKTLTEEQYNSSLNLLQSDEAVTLGETKVFFELGKQKVLKSLIKLLDIGEKDG